MLVASDSTLYIYVRSIPTDQVRSLLSTSKLGVSKPAQLWLSSRPIEMSSWPRWFSHSWMDIGQEHVSSPWQRRRNRSLQPCWNIICGVKQPFSGRGANQAWTAPAVMAVGGQALAPSAHIQRNLLREDPKTISCSSLAEADFEVQRHHGGWKASEIPRETSARGGADLREDFHGIWGGQPFSRSPSSSSGG